MHPRHFIIDRGLEEDVMMALDYLPKRLNVKPKKNFLIHCPMIGADRIVYTDAACGECEMRVRIEGRRYTFPGTRPD